MYHELLQSFPRYLIQVEGQTGVPKNSCAYPGLTKVSVAWSHKLF